MGSILAIKKMVNSPGKPESMGSSVFLFDGNKLAEEIVFQILLWTDFKTLLRCRLVCTQWNRIISDPLFWKSKCHLKGIYFPELNIDLLSELSFKTLGTLFAKRPPFNKNLIVNAFAKDQLEKWQVLSRGGDGWAFECPPQGSDPVPEEAFRGENTERDLNSCFATSYHSCSKQQIIDLHQLGFIPEVLDPLPLAVEVRDWYAGRFDCGCVYEMQVELLDSKKNTIDSFNFRDEIAQWEGRDWHKVETRFVNITGNVQFIRFYHGGTDNLFWAGYYGTKMTGSSVRILLDQPKT